MLCKFLFLLFVVVSNISYNLVFVRTPAQHGCSLLFLLEIVFYNKTKNYSKTRDLELDQADCGENRVNSGSESATGRTVCYYFKKRRA